MPEPTPTPETESPPAPPHRPPPSVALVPVEPLEHLRRRGGRLRSAVELALDVADALADEIRRALAREPERDRA
jgi:hypothetical protein